ncbi:hypothetical protein [Streptomyces sp. NBC_00258]|uniref:hypothetical protein n=1 Tax=Streptomyces sp. NBC_00258 TaxID=2903642 RepID=UPI002E2D9DE8|nr:hypothetical protein [Streptomyces sp. NBC_00258]
MRIRTLVTTAVLLAGLAACGASGEEELDRCRAALEKLPAKVPVQPEACEGLSEDDYNTLLMAHIIEETNTLVPTTEP